MSKIEVNTVDVQCGSTLTLGSSGKTVTLATGASQSGFGRTGTVDWCTTVKTTAVSAASGKGYFVNTTCGAITVTLPASPSAGDIVAVKDYAGTFGTNGVTLGRNGQKIGGGSLCATLSTDNSSQTLIFTDATKGWMVINDATVNIEGVSYTAATGGTVSTCGDYKYHKFTSTSCFAVSTVGSSCSGGVRVLVIGGGGGASTNGSGGAGAGGLREVAAACVPVSATTYPVTVGAGGTGATASATSGTSSVFSTITSAGGGYGGVASCSPGTVKNGSPGGSGGGGAGNGRQGALGNGNDPPTSPSQGNPGGASVHGPSPNSAGGGGGGATAAGATAGPPRPGDSRIGGAGGAGTCVTANFPAPLGGDPAGNYGGGGGGAANNDGGFAGPAGAGGSGGGGCGLSGTTPSTDSCGAANTGGGAGGGPTTGANPSGAGGGSGIVIIKYKYQ